MKFSASTGPWDLKKYLNASSGTDQTYVLWNKSTMGAKEHGEGRFTSRYTSNRQITLNVWGNILYSWLGMDAGFSSGILQGGPNAIAAINISPHRSAGRGI
jgi:hypothetical protein